MENLLLADRDVQRLRERVRGPVLRPGDSDYEDEHAGFNRVLQRRPALVVGATDATDVVAAVRFAADAGLPVAVQATGHGPTQDSEGAVLISTRRMSGVLVEPGPALATVAAGVRWSQVITAGAAHGLAPLNGSSPSVGVVGYTLGGGLGVLARTYGYAADHVRRLDVVTGDGRLRRVTAEQHDDLFWALRGGKFGFGIVTSMQFGLVPLERFYAGGLYFDAATAADVLPAYLAWTRTVPDDLTSSVAVLRLPDVATVPEILRGRAVLHVRVAYAGDAAAGESLIGSLRSVAPVLHDNVASRPYETVGAVHNDPTEPFGFHEHSTLLGDLDDAAAAALVDAALGDDSTLMTEVRHLGGGLRHEPVPPNAVPNRDAAYCLTTIVPATGPAVPEVHHRLARWGSGRGFLNFLAGPEAGRHVGRTHPADDAARLASVRQRYDPAGVFRPALAAVR